MLLFVLGICVVILGVFLFKLLNKPLGFVAWFASAILFIASCMAIVPTGHTGVVATFGKVADYTFESGINMKAPWSNVVKMDNRTQKASLETACFSSDIQEVTVTFTLNYNIQKENAQKIYKNIGKNYYETVVVPSIQESLKTVTAKYTAEGLINSRSDLALNVQNELSAKLNQYNINVIDVSIENMDFTDAFEKAVEEKQVAQQNKLKAETQAAQKIIEAEAEAKAKIIAAEAEAEAYRIQSSQITESLLKKWELDARLKHGWVTIQGANTIVKE